MGSSATKVVFGTFDEVSRGEWGARPPIATEHLELPAGIVVVHFTNTKTCTTREECVRIVQELQRKHIDDNNLIDIKYNFLVGGDGAIYEGRGWHAIGIKVPLIHELLLQGDLEPVDIAFIGSIEDVENSPKMQQTLNDFIKVSQYRHYIIMDLCYLWMEGGDKFRHIYDDD